MIAEDTTALRGKQFIYGLFSAIFMGQFQEYKKMMNGLPGEQAAFPFHRHFHDDRTALVDYENLFAIPGDHYIPPYFSYYANHLAAGGEIREQLLCLIGLFERFGYYYPIEKEQYPDHIAMLLSFMQATLALEEQANQYQDHSLIEQAKLLQKQFMNAFLLPWVSVFLDRVKKQELSAYYREAALYLHEFLDAEKTELQGSF